MRKCQTPGAIYTFMIKDTQLAICVGKIPAMNLTEDQAIKLEDELHDAVEAVLKQFWVKSA